MTEKPRRLGRGLEALLGAASATATPPPAAPTSPTDQAPATHNQLRSLPIDRIRANPFQPRREFAESELASLADSLREAIDLFRADGRYFRHGEDFFALPSWVQVMLGQRILPRGYHPIVDEMPDTVLAGFVEQARQDIARTVEAMPSHRQFIDGYCKSMES